MNRLQKQSWIMIGSTGIAFLISCMVVVYWAATRGFPFAWKGFLFTLFGGLGYIGCLFVRKDKPAIMDERDRAIKELAKNNAFIAAYLSFILFTIGIFIYKKPGALINVNILPMFCCLNGVIIWSVESLTYLIAYRKGGNEV
jgi:hypothetical protein